MTETYLAQPDLGFIAQIRGLGGDTLRKLFRGLSHLTGKQPVSQKGNDCCLMGIEGSAH